MITPTSITDLPRDIMKPILLEITDSLATLKVYQQVSKEFKAVADDPDFLHALLVKFKGPSFSDSINKNASKKFLLLDQDMTIAFRMIVARKKDFNEINKNILKTTASIALKNLNLFTIANGSNITYFRLAKTEVENLNKVDSANQEQWQKCMMNIATCMAEHNFSDQVIAKGDVPFFKKVESGFLNPNEKMQKLIKDYEITDIFFGEPDSLVIHAHKGNELNLSIIEEATLEFEHYKFTSTCHLLYEFLEEVSLIVVEEQIVVKLSDEILQELITKLKELNKDQKDLLERSFSSEYYKFLIGSFFSEFWPDNLKDLGKEKCREQGNRLIISGFMNSLEIVVNEADKDKVEMFFDQDVKDYLLTMLKDPSNGLKECFEKYCSAKVLPIVQEFIFPGIWT